MAKKRTSAVRSVLIVDDDQILLKAYLRDLRGRTVFTAADNKTAKSIAEREKPDLAIVDLFLGGESGIELIRDLKTARRTRWIVLTSGYLTVDFAVAAVTVGADAVICKPTRASEILRRVEEHDLVLPRLEVDDTPTLARAEWDHIARVLADCHGNISMAARRLGIYRSSLQRRLRKPEPRA